MKQNYNICLTRLLKDEGGYTNDPSDNGGPTNFGITLADYRQYINCKGTPQDVKNMPVSKAKDIYRSKYWNALSCDSLPSGVDYTCFDYAVNSGLGRPRKALQTFKSLSGTKLIDAINNERVSFLKDIGVGHNAKFLRGWLARVSRVRSFSKQLSEKNTTTGPIAGATITGFALTVSQLWHNHEILIILSGIGLAVILGFAIHHYINRGKHG